MSKWDIQPSGVRAVLGRVQGHAEEMNAAVTSFADNAENAAVSAQSSIVATAMGDFMAASQGKVARLTGLIAGADEGAAKATLAYLHGDEAMAANAQGAVAAIGRTPVGKSAAAMARLGMG